MEEKIKQIITDQMDPVLKLHNGSCEFVSYEDGVLTVKLLGGCVGCPSSKITLLNGIKPIIESELPEVQDVMLA